MKGNRIPRPHVTLGKDHRVIILLWAWDGLRLNPGEKMTQEIRRKGEQIVLESDAVILERVEED